MPKGSRIMGVFYLGVLVGSAAIVLASMLLRGKFLGASRADAWSNPITTNTKDIPFICLSNCMVVGPSNTNGPGFGNRLAGKDLSGAYIGDFTSSGGNDFSRIILRGAYLPNFSSSQGDIWRDADFSNAWMENADLDADFSGANFSGADLSNANLIGNFSGANFSGANLSNTELMTGTFTGANFSGVRWGSATCPNGTTATVNGCTGSFTVTP